MTQHSSPIAGGAGPVPRRTWRAWSWGRRVLVALGLPAVLVALWWVASARAESFFFPPLSEILEVFVPTWFEGRIVGDVIPSLGRLLAGYAVALAGGIALGVAIGMSRVLRAFTEPVLEFFRAIPPPVLVPILMLFLGIGTSMKIVVIAAGAIWPILLNTVEGVRAVDEVLRDTATVYRLGPVRRLRTLVLRGASPQIVTGARQALSIAIILMVISEMFASSSGLGFVIIVFQRTFAIPEMWSGIVLLGLIGLALSLFFQVIEKRVLAWYFGLKEVENAI